MIKYSTVLIILLFLISCTKNTSKTLISSTWEYSYTLNTPFINYEKSNGVITFTNNNSGILWDMTNGIQSRFHWSINESNLIVTLENGLDYSFKRMYLTDRCQSFILEENLGDERLVLVRR